MPIIFLMNLMIINNQNLEIFVLGNEMKLM